MKIFAFTGVTAVVLTLMAFQVSNVQSITLTGELTNCNKNNITLFEHDGVQLKAIQQIPLTLADGKATINTTLNVKEEGFYFIGVSERDYKIILLNKDKSINIKGNCSGFKALQVNSPSNNLYQQVNQKLNGFSREMQNLLTQYRQAGRDQTILKALDTKLADLDQRRTAFRDDYKTSHPVIYKMIALQTYLSYQNNKAPNQTEADYFARNFINNIDFKDVTYNHVPHLMDVARNYSGTLNTIGLTNDSQITAARDVINKFPANTTARKSVHTGLMLGFMEKNNAAFTLFAKEFIEVYGAQNPSIVSYLKGKLASMASFIIGGEAPDLTYNTPEGTPLSLSSLRGKVVMIDFWASWCGPCRKENPHVKKLYSKYNAQGFEILGVSLDRKKTSWLAAIEKDGLPWPHISDLKGWQSEAAKTYGVSSIPQTVLVDREGKIIARNLRGPALDKKLAEIFATPK